MGNKPTTFSLTDIADQAVALVHAIRVSAEQGGVLTHSFIDAAHPALRNNKI